MDAKTINTFPIRDYLAEKDIRPVIDRGYYGMYRSPMREDRTPSMKVDYTKNLWIDYGTGNGGTLIDLVMRLERCDAERQCACWNIGSPACHLFLFTGTATLYRHTENRPLR